jgi:hypothetical protein
MEEGMALDIHGIAPLLQVFDMPVSVRSCRHVLGFGFVQTSRKLSENADDVNWRCCSSMARQ